MQFLYGFGQFFWIEYRETVDSSEASSTGVLATRVDSSERYYSQEIKLVFFKPRRKA
jgi:hypothetical protein